MTEENNSPNSNNTEQANDKRNNTGSTTSDTQPSEERSHRNRRRPRRTGGQGINKGNKDRRTGGNTQPEQAVEDGTGNNSAVDSVNNTALSTPSGIDAGNDLETQAADEAAMAEGGIKAVGNQRIINFMGIQKPMVIFSGLLVIIAIVALFTKGLNLGLDFTGGVSADVVYEQPIENTEQLVKSLADEGFDDALVQYLGTRQELLVRLPPQDNSIDGLNDALDNALQLEGNKATVDNVNIIGSQVGNEVYLNSLMAMGLALACMLIYVAIRFQFKLSVGAVAALFHDAIVTLGIFAIMGWPFDLTVLAAVLALIGYSLNDTIVVYDRIRENFRRVRGLSPAQVVNLSLTETLRRTFMTSMTVLLVVWAMMGLGGEGLFWFSVALFIGMVAGTYSSVYIASAIPLMMGMSRDDFVVTVKPEFEEEIVSFEDRNAPVYDDDEY